MFGSAPPSPTLLPSQSSNAGVITESSHILPTQYTRSGNFEPSDVPRLQSAHSTAGYREGLAEGKNSNVQAGFDEGYSLGVTVGLRVGVVLGVLEGIAAALEVKNTGADENADTKVAFESMESLVTEARRELSTESVFGPEYWGKDGVWIYNIPGEETGGEVTWKEVVDAHPLVKKWEEVVKNKAEIYRVSLEGLEGEERDDETAVPAERIHETEEAKAVVGKKKEIEW